MTDTNPAGVSGNIAGSVLFYDQPEPLSFEAHGNLKLTTPPRPHAFVAKSNIVPLTVTEFAPAALSYPVIFVGDNRQPVVVMGLRDGENLFVNADGQLRPDAYIPAYVRRYPFVFANDPDNQRMILCIDRASPAFSESEGEPLFADGKPTPLTEHAMEFCNNFEQERLRTESFVNLLKDLDLLEVREQTFTPRNPDGSLAAPQKVAEFYAVSEDKLRAMDPAKLAELRDNGALGQIYAHLISLQGWERMIAMAFERAAQTPAAANA